MLAAAQRSLFAGGTLALVTSHISLGDYALMLIAAGWIIGQLRNWRPINALREENRDLRESREKIQHLYDELEKKCADLEARCAQLEKSRDFHEAFQESLRAIDQARADSSHEHEAILRAIEADKKAQTAAWSELQKTATALSTGVTALAAGINAGSIAIASPTDTNEGAA